MHETPWLIVPMAGFGKRFRDAGYQDDKPLIKIGGRRLLDWSMQPIPKSWWGKVLTIARSGQTQLRDELSDWLWNGEVDCTEFECITIHGPTQGAACTVLAAAVGLPPDSPVCVMNADQYFKCDLQATYDQAMASGWDGFILVFPGTGPAWSYAVTNGTNRIVHVIEKKQVSPYATCGFYFWRRAGDLVRSICAMIATGQKTNQEFYLAPSFCFLPLSDKNVQIVEVEEFHGLGTPEQVKGFEALLATGWTP